MNRSLLDIVADIKQESVDDAPGAAPVQGGLMAGLQQGQPLQQLGAAFHFQPASPLPWPTLQLQQQAAFVPEVPSAGLDDGSYGNACGWHNFPVYAPLLVGDEMATGSSATAIPPYGHPMGFGADGSSYWLPLPAMPTFEPAVLSAPSQVHVPVYAVPVTQMQEGPSSGNMLGQAPPTPPPSTSRYQESAMESAVRQMWRARTTYPYSRETILEDITSLPYFAGQPQPGSLDEAVGALWKAKGGIGPLPYDTAVRGLVALASTPRMTPAAAPVLPTTAPMPATPAARQEPPVRQPSALHSPERLVRTLGPWAAAGPTGWTSDYFAVRVRRIERQASLKKAAAKKCALKKEAEKRQADKKAAAREARKQKSDLKMKGIGKK